MWAQAKDLPSAGATEAFLHEARLSAARLTLEFERLQSDVRRACNGSMRSDVVFPSTTRAAAVALAVLAAACRGDVAPPPAADPGGRAGVVEVESQALPEAERAPREPSQGGPRGTRGVRPTIDGRSGEFVLDARGRVTDVELENGEPLPPDVKDCYLRAVEGQTFPCLGEQYWSRCFVLLK